MKHPGSVAFKIPIVTITKSSKCGQWGKTCSVGISNCAFDFLQSPKEVCILNDSRGIYLIESNIDSTHRYKISFTKKGGRLYPKFGAALTEQLESFIGQNLLSKEGDKYYLENIA